MDFIKCDAAIIGGGAAGLTAALSIVKQNKRLKTAIFEHHPRTGKKLMATGNGRCNLTNVSLTGEAYSGSAAEYVNEIIKRRGCEYITDYFAEIGLLTRTDSEGRVYPISNNASSVLDALRNYNSACGVKEYCNTTITKIIPEKSGYTLVSDNLRVFAKNVVIACGGKASPKLATNGFGYQLLSQLGISVNMPMPSLVPIPCANKCLTALKGLRVKGSVSLIADGKAVKTEQGEIQFGSGTLSGICVFQLSRMVSEYFTHGTVNGVKTENIKLSLDIMPSLSQKQAIQLLQQRAQLLPSYTLNSFFDGFLHKRLAHALYNECRIKDLSRRAASLSKKELFQLADKLKAWQFTPTSCGSFESAQVTAGGASADEIDFSTCQCKKYKGLYIVGELADADGICGGYNLHWAWCSGIIAGENIAKNLVRKNDKAK